MFVIPFYVYSLASQMFQKYLKTDSDYQELMNESFSSIENSEQLSPSTLKPSYKRRIKKIGSGKKSPLNDENQFKCFLLYYILNTENLSLDYYCKNLNIHDRPIEKFVLDFQSISLLWPNLEENIILFLKNIVTQIYEVNFASSRLLTHNGLNQQTIKSSCVSSRQFTALNKPKSNYYFFKRHKKVFKCTKPTRSKIDVKHNKNIQISLSDKSKTSVKIKDVLFFEEPNINKVLLQEIVDQRFNLIQNEVYLAKVLTEDAHDEFYSDWTVAVYVEHVNINNNISFIDRVKEDLVTGLMESHFPRHTSITYTRVTSIRTCLSSWEFDQSIAAVFPHQRLTSLYSCVLVLSECCASLLRHPHLAFYETLSSILQTPVEHILTALAL